MGDAGVLGPEDRKLTVEQWEALDDGRRELVDGVLQEEDVSSFRHDLVVSFVLESLGPWARERGGFTAAPGVRYALGPRRGRIPDASVFLAGRRPNAQGLVRVPPDIAIEVVSPSPRHERRDRVDKIRDYAAFGIARYWILDPNARTLHVHELGEDGRYRIVLAAADGRIAEVPGCTGLTLDLDALGAELDRLEADPDGA